MTGMNDDVADKTFGSIPDHLGAMAVMDKTGDSKVTWDPNQPAEVEAARAQFDVLKKKGYSAFRMSEGGDQQGAQMRDFDASARRIIFVPQMQGG